MKTTEKRASIAKRKKTPAGERAFCRERNVMAVIPLVNRLAKVAAPRARPRRDRGKISAATTQAVGPYPLENDAMKRQRPIKAKYMESPER